ncbi:transmembrane protease serine 9-like [Macrobrachium nipponense]|uniref:transmembrane protease serine 9-like n=1 Tax=Macrobrachium nipponense TaxID=159736 RepID=UPI0030C81D69
MEDIKLKSIKEVDTLIQTVRIVSGGIRMEFEIENVLWSTYKKAKWVIRPLGRGSVAQQQRNISHVQPRWSLMPRNSDFPTIQPSPKKGRSNYVSCGDHSLEPGQNSQHPIEDFPENIQGMNTVAGLSRYCGRNDGLTTASSTNYMGILFRTGSSRRRGRGFSCTVSASGEDNYRFTSGIRQEFIFYSFYNKKRPKWKGQSLVVPVALKHKCQQQQAPKRLPLQRAQVLLQQKQRLVVKKLLQPRVKPCGTVNRATRIVGGVETEVNEYPWQAALVYAGTNIVFCGGSLLNDELVFTAGHCIDAILHDVPDFIVDSFDEGIEPTSDEEVIYSQFEKNMSKYPTRLGIADVGSYYLYDSSTMDHDIGLIWLSSPVTLSERVKPVCLPDVSKNYSGFKAVTSGWGSLTEGGSSPDILNEVDVPVITNEACNASYDGAITSNMICAGYPSGGKDACQGDSGGPLVVEDNGRWVLVGITSWGNGCARPNYPGVYARVTQYVSALLDVMGQYGANTLCNGTIAPTPIQTSAATPVRTTLAPTNGPSPPPTPPPPSDSCKCGRRNPVTRIVGGQPTTVHEYPWQVALTTSTRPFCGGSIISKQWILTAAHCVSGSSPSDFTVVIGEHDWSTTSETTSTERRQVSNIIVHSQYDSTTLDNDMALLKLSSPISFPLDNKIAPVCLPDPNNDYANVDAIVTGWGTTSSGGSQPYELYEVTVPTMTNSKCSQAYSGEITSNMICAGLDAGGKDSCQGDSGGPMVTAGNAAQTFMIQIGVVSWGYGCAAAGNPGVYARVNNYLSWISSNTAGSETCPRP